jgi:hypothetical protein
MAENWRASYQLWPSAEWHGQRALWDHHLPTDLAATTHKTLKCAKRKSAGCRQPAWLAPRLVLTSSSASAASDSDLGDHVMKQVPRGRNDSFTAEAITEVGIRVIGQGEPDWVLNPSTAKAYWTDESSHQTLYQVSQRGWILLEKDGWITSREVRNGRPRFESRRVGTGRVLQDSEAAAWLLKRGEELPPELQSVAAQLKHQQVAWRPGDPIPQGLLAGLAPLQLTTAVSFTNRMLS